MSQAAGLGPAAAFLYAGPAINVLAVILTARILGFQLGLARAIGAVLFSVVVGLLMAWIHRREERGRAAAHAARAVPEPRLSLPRQAAFFAALVAILVFANWAPGESVHITPRTVHRMTAVEDSDILEASTPELDDVVRLEDRYGRTT